MLTIIAYYDFSHLARFTRVGSHILERSNGQYGGTDIDWGVFDVLCLLYCSKVEFLFWRRALSVFNMFNNSIGIEGKCIVVFEILKSRIGRLQHPFGECIRSSLCQGIIELVRRLIKESGHYLISFVVNECGIEKGARTTIIGPLPLGCLLKNSGVDCPTW